MTPLDIATCLNAGIAFLALALRGNMLKPEALAWSTNRAASLTIIGLSVIMGGVAVHVFGHGGATGRELAMTSAVAFSSIAMLVNLWIQKRSPSQTKDAAP